MIEDTPFDHLTKQNFKQTIREMGAFNFINFENGILPNGLKTSNSRVGRGGLFYLILNRQEY